MIAYISIDPGEKTSGICEWDEEGNLLNWYERDFDATLDYLEQIPSTLKVLIYEEYRIRGNKTTQHAWSTVPTLQLIGSINYVCTRRKIKTVAQQASILQIASKWAQMPIPKKAHLRDWKSAYLHGYYYLHRAGIIKSLLLEKTNDN